MMALAGRSEMTAIDPDGVVNATNPLHAQIFQLVAEDAAMEDTLYQLGGLLFSLHTTPLVGS